MEACGYSTHDQIVADDKVNRLKVNGEKTSSFTYQLKIESDFAVGWMQSHKDGEKISFASQDKSIEVSPEERAARDKARQAATRKRDKENRERRASAAEKCKEIYKDAGPLNADHPYLLKKGIEAPKLWKKSGDSIVIPAYIDGKISTVQYIAPDGSKKFHPDGEIKGAYSFIGNGKPEGIIYIAEGGATAQSIHAATGMFAVICFNAGNMARVADTIAARNSHCKVTIAADNDRFTFKHPKPKELDGLGIDTLDADDPRWEKWRADGLLNNVGVEKAKAVGFPYVEPIFDPKSKGTDWNDYHAENGLGKLAIELNRQPAPVKQEVEPNDDWKMALEYKGGKLDKKNLRNTALMLEHADIFKDKFRLNDFMQAIVTPDDDGRIGMMQKEDITQAQYDCEFLGVNSNREVVNNAIELIARKKRFNPAIEYFDKLVWDGERRLDTWLTYYLGATNEPAEYLAFIGKKWLTAAVKRTYQAGCKFDHVLVIEGSQGLGKSTALRTLSTFGDDEEEAYFTDSVTVKDIENKDSVMQMAGSLIVELAEMVGFGKRADEEMKRWVTLQKIKVRLAYAKYVQEFPRTFVLAATTNSYDYLNDPSGNRRYWPFESTAIDIEALRKDRNQLWAEAVHWYKQNLYLGPTPEEQELAHTQTQKRLSVDPWESNVMEALVEVKHRPFRVSEIMDGMKMQLREKDKAAEGRIKRILTKMGYENKQMKIDGVNRRMWVNENDD